MKMRFIFHTILCSMLFLSVGCSKIFPNRSARILFESKTAVYGDDLFDRRAEIRDRLLESGQFRAVQPRGMWILYGVKGGPYQDAAVSLQSRMYGNNRIMVACNYRFLRSKDAKTLTYLIEAAIGERTMQGIKVSTWVESIFPPLGPG